MYDVIVIGAGFAGSIVARECAEKLNKKVLVLEKRNHIAGNMYDEKDENGILIQKYGPHFFCTYEWWIIDYLSKFSEWYVWQPRAMSFVDGKYLWRPYNFHTVQQLLGPENSSKVLNKMRGFFKGRKHVSVYELVNHTDEDVSAYGRLIYDKLYVSYCAKQWGLKPDEMDRSIIDRAQISMGYDWQLGEEIDFQYLPKNGYTALFRNILDHKNIEVVLNEDGIRHLSFESDGKVLYEGKEVPIVYTGATDALFDYKYGELPYRSRHFEYNTFDNEGYELPVEVVTYPQGEPYLRRTEYKRFNNVGEKIKKTVIADEYSVDYNRMAETGNEPYYPINNQSSSAMFEKYMAEADKYTNLYLCGRLAEFKYLDMHTVIAKAFQLADRIVGIESQ